MIRALLVLALGLAPASPPARAPEGAPAAPPMAGGALVDRVVAVVRSPATPDPQVLTLSRLQDETRIALVSRGALLAATQPLDGTTLRAGLDWLVDQLLLDAEATRLQVYETDAEAAEAEVARFRGQFPRPADYQEFLARLELTQGELDAVLRRTLRVSRYLESRVSQAAQVSEAELSAWMDQHAAEIGSRDRDAARAQLARQRAGEEARALVRDLRARAEVRVLVDLAAPGAAPSSAARPGGRA